MSNSANGPVLLGKRKRACERCARGNLPCDSGGNSSCQSCLAAGTACQITSSPANSLTGLPPRQLPMDQLHHSRDGLPDSIILARHPEVLHPRPDSNGSMSTGLDRVAQWQASPASAILSQSSHQTLASQVGSHLSPYDHHEGLDHPNDEAGTVSRILSRFLDGTHELNRSSGVSKGDIPLPVVASLFRTYFAVIHPQYPFLDIKLCANYYIAWRDAPPDAAPAGWPAFFVNMIFAIGSLIESKSDNSAYPQYQNLKSRAQAEQSIMADSTSTPLIRLQAMLLSAMFALHAESTWRIAHISGAIIRFATLHRFHRQSNDPADPASSISIRAWSCAYVLDRAVSSALGTPVSLPDMYISTPLFEFSGAETVVSLPWLVGCAAEPTMNFPDIRTFAYICKIRALQSFFMHMVEKDNLEDSIPPELEMHMLKSLREWEDPIAIQEHSVQNSHGYRSALWLYHIGHLTRLSICLVNKSNIFSSAADMAFETSCAVCTSFRALQKKKQVAQPWLVVLSQFRAAVTLWYIVWARAIAVPREANDAFRDCSAVLAIFADRWPKAEHYRDCFELLAVSIPRSQPPGCLGEDIRRDLKPLIHKLEGTGIHRTTSRMLWEMCTEEASPLPIAD